MNKISETGIGSVSRFTPEKKSTFSRYCPMDTRNPWREDARTEGVLNYIPNGDLEFRRPTPENNSLESQSTHFSPIATMGGVGVLRTLHVMNL